MTRILLISPKLEIVVHNIPIFNNNDVKKVQAFIKNKEEQYGELERIIISMGTVRIMDQKDEIPVPLQQPAGDLIAPDAALVIKVGRDFLHFY